MGARKTLSASGVRATVGVGVRMGVQVSARVGVAAGGSGEPGRTVAVVVGQGGVRMATGRVAVVGKLGVFEQPVTASPKVSHNVFDITQPKVTSLPFTLRQHHFWRKRKERTAGQGYLSSTEI
jgi:hypothetical protein